MSLGLIVLGFLLRFARFYSHFPDGWDVWPPAIAIAWVILVLCWSIAFGIIRLFSPKSSASHNAGRRTFLKTAQAAVLVAPPAALGYGMFIERNDLRLREVRLDIPGLPHDLDGLRLVQLTDIHLSPFLDRKQLQRAVAMANETRPHLALITGDLITTAKDPLDDCLNLLQSVRADAGVFGCMGNHEQYADAEEYTESEGARRGIRFLRHGAAPLRFGSATLNLAGVDYQRINRPYLRGAEKLVVPGAFNLLLSHNPDVFPVAAAQGFPLTVSGHTHGGQVRVEIVNADLNPARFYTRYVDGIYRRNGSSIFVSRGIGTIGIPARFGAPPEVALLQLCRA